MRPPNDLVRRVRDILDRLDDSLYDRWGNRRNWKPGELDEVARDLIDLIDSHMTDHRRRSITEVADDIMRGAAAGHVYPEVQR